jgi:hypothetical protein
MKKQKNLTQETTNQYWQLRGFDTTKDFLLDRLRAVPENKDALADITLFNQQDDLRRDINP